MNNDLMGFVLYEPTDTRRTGVFITGRSHSISLSDKSLNMIGNPEYINIFFKPGKKQMMIMASQKDFENNFPLKASGGSRTRKNNVNSCELKRQIAEIVGVDDIMGMKFAGYQYDENYLRYDLSRNVRDDDA